MDRFVIYLLARAFISVKISILSAFLWSSSIFVSISTATATNYREQLEKQDVYTD